MLYRERKVQELAVNDQAIKIYQEIAGDLRKRVDSLEKLSESREELYNKNREEIARLRALASMKQDTINQITQDNQEKQDVINQVTKENQENQDILNKSQDKFNKTL